MKAQNRMSRIYNTYKEAKKAKRWDAVRECYLDPKGNIAVDPDSISVDALIQQIAEEEEGDQRLWWGGGEEKEKEKENEKEPQTKKVDDMIIDTPQEFTAENLKKMADKVLAAKELEVVSGSRTESKSKVSQNDAINESGKKAKTESDCKNCMKNWKELPRSFSQCIMDSGASQHMTGKKTLLYDVRGFNGGYVGFAENQGGRIVGEGTLSNGIVTFERVNYIAELENNLLSISQICDRMYTTHFADK
ncbi:uncharacterized protein LOC110893075 [Helianthus annuus]|uniref:uncharacterized protein LOC110893075 n=1 Tax=Helianthus annuus TaxID=4232 RepID=UPI000B907A89|nr:uncharacterized protein LOC110893075 [Helianthus annuus]